MIMGFELRTSCFQALYHSSHAPVPFSVSYFSARVSLFVQGWPQTTILSRSDSLVAGITDVSHCARPPSDFFFLFLFFFVFLPSDFLKELFNVCGGSHL
jgi:hypothetical protein